MNTRHRMTITRFIALLITCISASTILFAGCNTNDEPTASPTSTKVNAASSVYDGEESFQNRCAVCHGQQADGTANRSTSRQPLVRNRTSSQLLLPQRRQQRRDRTPLELRRHAVDTQRRTRRRSMPSSATFATSNAPKASPPANPVNASNYIVSRGSCRGCVLDRFRGYFLYRRGQVRYPSHSGCRSVSKPPSLYSRRVEISALSNRRAPERCR